VKVSLNKVVHGHLHAKRASIGLQGGGNPFANMGNMLEQMKKAQQLVQVEAAQVQTELAETDFEGYSSDETVRVVMSGNQEPRSVDFTDEALEQGPEVCHWRHGLMCSKRSICFSGLANVERGDSDRHNFLSLIGQVKQLPAYCNGEGGGGVVAVLAGWEMQLLLRTYQQYPPRLF
jgi:hypothetical protein